jgi:hypothetical protein
MAGHLTGNSLTRQLAELLESFEQANISQVAHRNEVGINGSLGDLLLVLWHM